MKEDTASNVPVNSANPSAVAGLGSDPPGPNTHLGRKKKKLHDILTRRIPKVADISPSGFTMSDRTGSGR